jgi:hypothetical protein
MSSASSTLDDGSVLAQARPSSMKVRVSSVADPHTTVRADVERLLTSPSLPPKVSVSGHVHDIATGRVLGAVATLGLIMAARWRVLYRIDEPKRTVVVQDIQHRGTAYRHR